MGFILWIRLESNEKFVDYSHDVKAIIKTIGMSCQNRYCCSLQESFIGMIDDKFSYGIMSSTFQQCEC